MAIATPKKKYKRAFPSFSTLWNAFPPKQYYSDGTMANSIPCDEGSIDPITKEFNLRYGNQCAIRLSSCLIKCGISLATYTDPKCNHGFARGAESLASWIWRTFGPPEIIKDSKGFNKFLTTTSIQKQGIIFFKDFYSVGGEVIGDHIDLIINGTTASLHGNYAHRTALKQIWFWEIA